MAFRARRGVSDLVSEPAHSPWQGRGRLLLQGDPDPVASWARRGLMPVHVVPLQGWTAVQPCRGTTCTGIRPRRAHEATGSGSPCKRSLPRPCQGECAGSLTRSETPLRARNAIDLRVKGDSGAQGSGYSLELCLDYVMRVAAGQHPHMQRDAAVMGEALQHVSSK